MKRILTLITTFGILMQAFAQEPNRPKKVILMIGDGMGLAQITAAMAHYKGRNAFDRFKVIGLSKTSSADNYITDSGAGATVFSIGKKTYNGAIGVDKDSLPAENLFEKMKKVQRATGVVVTSSITHATPASFYAHVPSRKSAFQIARFLLNDQCDIAIGGGARFFFDPKYAANLSRQLQQKGFKTLLDSTATFTYQTSPKLIYTLAGDGMPTMQEGRGDFLTKASLNAMDLLNHNKSGYLLMIEGSQIDWGGHDMDFEYMKLELHDFNETINAVLDRAEQEGDILVVVTADHETGGLSLNENSENRSTYKPHYTYSHHTGVMVPVYAFGPGASEFGGTYENTEIFFKLKTLLQLP